MFKNKKILIVVPHQDDEINIAGGFIAKYSKENEIYVLYTTNGDYIYDAEVRVKESLESCKTLGVKEDQVLFLGYSDQYSNGETHLYTTNDIWTSRNGLTETYLPLNKKEIIKRCRDRHSVFNRDNFIADIQLVIERLLPDVMVCVDFDSHCDHRAASLAFEHALGRVLKKTKNYTPLIYKGFAYPTAYFGDSDFDSINMKSTGFNTEKHSYSAFENPYYDVRSEVRFLLSDSCIDKRLWKNKIFKALKCHRSQVIAKKAKSIINGDQLFFQRRTGNLLNEAKVEVSTGDGSKLNDFILFDCSNIMKGNIERPKLVDCAWSPTDKKPYINIGLNKKTRIESIKLYNALSSDKKNNFTLIIDGKAYGQYRFEGELINEIKFDSMPECGSMSLVFDNESLGLSLSELEVFEAIDNETKEIAAFIDGNIVYDCYVDKNFKFEVLAYDGNEQIRLEPGQLDFYVNDKKVECKTVLFENLARKNRIRIKLKDSDIQTSFMLRRKSKAAIISNKLLGIINIAYLIAIVFLQKVYRKIFIKKNY